MIIDLNFNIDTKFFLRRLDNNTLMGKNTQYICHFTFEGEEWNDVDKFVEFSSSKNKTYVGVLGKGLECVSAIPYAIMKDNCVIKVSVYGGNLITTNQVSLVLMPSGYTSEQVSTQPEFTDAFVDAYRRIANNFDNAIIRDNKIVFFADDHEVVELSFEDILYSQADWSETDTESASYILNKPELINNFKYQNNNLVCLSDNKVIQTVSLKHNHGTVDIYNFETDVDTD